MTGLDTPFTDAEVENLRRDWAELPWRLNCDPTS